MPPPEKAMPLSAVERRQFDEIEMSFNAADPVIAKNSITTLRRRSEMQAAALFAVGMIALVLGLVQTQNFAVAGICISVAGFLIMVWAVTRLPQFKSGGRPGRR